MDKNIGHKTLWIDILDSTNDEISRRIDSGFPPEPGEVIVAVEQSQGKGMGANQWVSEPGKNLTFSFLIHPGFIKAWQQFHLNIFVSLGVCNYLKKIFPEMSVKVKWPNDIYVDGKKIAGILISHAVNGTEILHTIVGIGLNVNQASFPGDIPNPVSMKQMSGHDFDLPDVLFNLTEALNESWKDLRKRDLSISTIKYKKAMFRYREWMEFRYENEIIMARILGISDVGLLLLENSDRDVIACDLKEIEFLI